VVTNSVTETPKYSVWGFGHEPNRDLCIVKHEINWLPPINVKLMKVTTAFHSLFFFKDGFRALGCVARKIFYRSRRFLYIFFRAFVKTLPWKQRNIILSRNRFWKSLLYIQKKNTFTSRAWNLYKWSIWLLRYDIRSIPEFDLCNIYRSDNWT